MVTVGFLRYLILVISKPKLDQTFPNSHVMIDGFRFLGIDRNVHGDGSLCFIYVFRLSLTEAYLQSNVKKYGTECIVCEVKVGRSWMTIASIYRPTSFKKSRWEFAMSNLFEMFTFRGDDVLFLGMRLI